MQKNRNKNEELNIKIATRLQRACWQMQARIRSPGSSDLRVPRQPISIVSARRVQVVKWRKAVFARCAHRSLWPREPRPPRPLLETPATSRQARCARSGTETIHSAVTLAVVRRCESALPIAFALARPGAQARQYSTVDRLSVRLARQTCVCVTKKKPADCAHPHSARGRQKGRGVPAVVASCAGEAAGRAELAIV